MLQLGMIHTNLHSISHQSLVMLCLQKFPSWSDFGMIHSAGLRNPGREMVSELYGKLAQGQ